VSERGKTTVVQFEKLERRGTLFAKLMKLLIYALDALSHWFGR